MFHESAIVTEVGEIVLELLRLRPRVEITDATQHKFRVAVAEPERPLGLIQPGESTRLGIGRWLDPRYNFFD